MQRLSDDPDFRALLKAHHQLILKVILMSASTDKLTAAFDRLEGTVSSAVVEMQALASRHDAVAGQATDDSAAVDSVADRLNALADTLQSAADQAKAVGAPAAPVAPAPQADATADETLADSINHAGDYTGQEAVLGAGQATVAGQDIAWTHEGLASVPGAEAAEQVQ